MRPYIPLEQLALIGQQLKTTAVELAHSCFGTFNPKAAPKRVSQRHVSEGQIIVSAMRKYRMGNRKPIECRGKIVFQ